MRLFVAAFVSITIAAYAHAEPRPPAPKKQQTVMRYRTLEKMLRRFSTLAGEAKADARTRG